MRTVREPNADMVDRMRRRIRDWELVPAGNPFVTAQAALQPVTRDGAPLMLKCAPLDSDEVQGFTALSAYGGEGAVRVLEIEDGCGLLERAIPGTPLADLARDGRDDEATAIWCDVAARLFQKLSSEIDPLPGVPDVNPLPNPLPSRGREPDRPGLIYELATSSNEEPVWGPSPLEGGRRRGVKMPDEDASGARKCPTTETWGEGFARYLGGPPHPALPHDLVAEAADLYVSLCASQGPRGLLHADLHHDNILFDERRGWLAIDAKGLIGEFGYEVWAMLHNPLGAEAMYTDPSVMKRRVKIVCERLELPPTRVLQWGAAQSILSGLAHVEDGDDDRFIHTSIAVANAAKRLLRVTGPHPL